MDAENAETMENSNELREAIIGSVMEVHRTLGLGSLKSTHGMCLYRELNIRGIPLEQGIPGYDCGYRAEIMVDGKSPVQINAADSPLPIHDARLRVLRLERELIL